MDIEQLQGDAGDKWASLPLGLRNDISILVRSAERGNDDSVVFNLTSSDSDHGEIAVFRNLARAVGSPHIRMVNGENYFKLSAAFVSVIISANADQLVLF